MKRKIVWTLALVTSIFILTACGESQYVGEWRFVNGTINGKEVSNEAIEKATGGTIKLTLSKNGNAVVEANGKRARSKWEETEDGIVVYDRTNKEKSTSYKLQDNQLCGSVNGLEIRLEKQ